MIYMYSEANCLKKKCIKIQLGHMVLEALINVQTIFLSITQELFCPTKKLMQIFLVSQTICSRMHKLFFSKSVDNFEIVYKTVNFGLGCSSPSATVSLRIQCILQCALFWLLPLLSPFSIHFRLNCISIHRIWSRSALDWTYLMKKINYP